LIGYFVTHSHLDHLAGLVIASPTDKFGANKPIISRTEVIEYLKSSVFNDVAWPNMPSYGYYRYEGLNMTHPSPLTLPECPGLEIVRGFPLSHTIHSTAFLLRSTASDEHILFFGDTGPDAVEGNNNMANVWAVAAPLIKEKKLLSIFLECSYLDPRKNSSLYGHLSPYWFNHELESLAKIVALQGGDASLTDLTVVVIHIKTPMVKGEDPRITIQRQLLEHQASSQLGVRFVFPQNGQLLEIFDFDNGVVQLANNLDNGGTHLNFKFSSAITVIIGVCIALFLV
jgi:3',5'-cyclic-nucleotide phosphodiesterase